MRKACALMLTAMVVGACADGLTSDQVQSQIDQSIAEALAASTTITAQTTTTEATTTTAPATTTTTEALPEFPPPREGLEHGGETWAVVLAASTGSSDPALQTAELAAESAGYRTGSTDCDLGVIEALGLPDEDHYYSVSVYFESESDAIQARDAFYARGIGSTVALVQTFCLD